jgi:hypothetical protein
MVSCQYASQSFDIPFYTYVYELSTSELLERVITTVVTYTVWISKRTSLTCIQNGSKYENKDKSSHDQL